MSGFLDEFDNYDWYDQTLVDIGINPATTSGPAVGNFYDEVMQSIGLTFEGDMPVWLSSDPDYTRALEIFKASGVDTTIKSVPQTAESAKTTADKTGDPGNSKGGGLIGRVTRFVDQNKSLSEMIGRGIQAVGAASAAKTAAKANSRSRIEELRTADEIKQADNARISASVSGLQTPSTRMPGIVDLARKKQARLSGIYGKT